MKQLSLFSDTKMNQFRSHELKKHNFAKHEIENHECINHNFGNHKSRNPEPQNVEYGGALLVGKRKSQRPLNCKKVLHLVLRADHKNLKFFNPKNKSLRLHIEKLASKYGVQIYGLVLNHSHIHFALKVPHRSAYVAFIRVLTSKLTLYFSKLYKVNLKGIFTHRPYTRIVEWGKAFQILKDYLFKNQSESGFDQGLQIDINFLSYRRKKKFDLWLRTYQLCP